MSCLCESEIREHEDDEFEFPSREIQDAWIDLEGEWEAPKWIDQI